MILQKRLGKTSTRYMAMSHPKTSMSTFLEPVTVKYTCGGFMLIYGKTGFLFIKKYTPVNIQYQRKFSFCLLKHRSLFFLGISANFVMPPGLVRSRPSSLMYNIIKEFVT